MGPKKKSKGVNTRSSSKNVKKSVETRSDPNGGLGNKSKQKNKCDESTIEASTSIRKGAESVSKVQKTSKRVRKDAVNVGTPTRIGNKKDMVRAAIMEDGNEMALELTREQDEEFATENEEELHSGVSSRKALDDESDPRSSAHVDQTTTSDSSDAEVMDGRADSSD